MAQRTPIRYWVSIGVTQGLGAACVLAGAVYFWSTSLLPVAAFLGLMVLPVAFYATVGAFAIDPTRTSNGFVDENSPTVGRRLLLATTPIFMFGAIFGLLLLAFRWTPARGFVVEIASAQGFYQVAESGLFDDEAQVRGIACQSIRKHSADISSPTLSRAMHYFDDIADCAMESVGPGANDILMEMQVSRWETELMSHGPQDPPERACALARRVFNADRIGVESAVPRLLACTTGADSDAARECCAQSLVAVMRDASSVADILPPPAQFAASSFQHRIRDVARLSRQEPTNAVQVRLGLHTPAMQAWSIRALCGALKANKWEAGLNANTLSEMVSGPSCQAPQATLANVPVWEVACGAATELPDAEIAETLCVTARTAVHRDAELSAQKSVLHALRVARFPTRSAAITSAIVEYVAEVTNANTKPRGSVAKDLMDLNDQFDAFRKGQRDDVDDFLDLLTESGVINPTLQK